MRVPVAPLTAVSVIALMLVLQLFGGFVKCYAARHRHWGALGYLHVVWMSAVSGIVTTILIALVWNTSEGWHPWHLAAYAPPLIGLSIAAGVMLLVGLMGADYPDAAREWTARLGSRFAMLLAAWTLLFGLTIDGPPLVAEVVHRLPRVGPTAIIMWLATTLGGVFAGRSPETSTGNGKTPVQRALETLVSIAPTMFLIAYVIAIAAGTHAVLASIAPPESTVQAAAGTSNGALLIPWYTARYWQVLTVDRANDRSEVGAGVLLLIVLAGVGIVAATRINVNEFSLHHYYKNRLVRCYLGASRAADRKPNVFTGFDPADDFPLASLSPDPDVGTPYYGPYPVVTASLNLNAGSELARQERKASSFVFTPAYSGLSGPCRMTVDCRSPGCRPTAIGARSGTRSPPVPTSGRRWRSLAPRRTRTPAITRRGRWRFS